MIKLSKKKITPVYIVGIGSSGANIIRYMRKNFENIYGSPHLPGIRYLIIESEEYIEKHIKEIQLNDNEFIPIPQVTTSFIEKINTNSWLPPASEIIDSNAGAGEIPSFGQIVLPQSNAFSKLNGLANNYYMDFLKNADPSESFAPQLICISNLMGGTGSAASKDTTAIFKNVFDKIDISPYTIIPNLSLLFRDVNKKNAIIQYLRSSGYFIELNGSDYIFDQKHIKNNDLYNSVSKYITGGLNLKLENQFKDPNLWLFQNIHDEFQRARIQKDTEIVNKEVLSYLNKNPDKFLDLTPRNFEIVTASIWKNLGYDIELTKMTRDGGKDFYAAINDAAGIELLYAIECKKYNPKKPVSVVEVRNLFGVTQSEKLTGGILVTTSYFSPDAKEFQKMNKYDISLKDFNDLKSLLTNSLKGKILL